jgi:hypothetical protein
MPGRLGFRWSELFRQAAARGLAAWSQLDRFRAVVIRAGSPDRGESFLADQNLIID